MTLSSLQSHAFDQPTPRERAERALAFCRRRCASGPTLSEVARHIGVSPNGLCELFRRELGTGVKRELRRARIESAKAKLLADVPPKAIAADLGYSCSQSFCRAFAAVEGTSPGRWLISELRARAGIGGAA